MLFSFTSAGTIEVGVLYAFISYLSRLNEPLIELTTQQSMLQQAVVAGERVFELMDRPRQRYGSDDRPLQSGAIDIDHLSFAYRDDNLVLQDITLSVPSRSFVALVGYTGSGKSTLASLLMGYYPDTRRNSAGWARDLLLIIAFTPWRGDGSTGPGSDGGYLSG